MKCASSKISLKGKFLKVMSKKFWPSQSQLADYCIQLHSTFNAAAWASNACFLVKVHLLNSSWNEWAGCSPTSLPKCIKTCKQSASWAYLTTLSSSMSWLINFRAPPCEIWQHSLSLSCRGSNPPGEKREETTRPLPNQMDLRHLWICKVRCSWVCLMVHRFHLFPRMVITWGIPSPGTKPSTHFPWP